MSEPKPIRTKDPLRLKYLISDVDRNGNRRWYVRRPDAPKIRMPAGPDSVRFMPAYLAAMAGHEAEPKKGKPARPSLLPRLSRAMDGYVYFMKVGETVKIGYSKTPQTRATAIGSAIPAKPNIFVAIPGSMRDEKRLHHLLASSRVNGEWFRATNAIIDLMTRAARHGVLMTEELEKRAEKRPNGTRTGDGSEVPIVAEETIQ